MRRKIKIGDYIYFTIPKKDIQCITADLIYLKKGGIIIDLTPNRLYKVTEVLYNNLVTFRDDVNYKRVSNMEGSAVCLKDKYRWTHATSLTIAKVKQGKHKKLTLQ